MNDLLFTALILATLYYFFYYLPEQQKLTTPPPISISKSVQTDPLSDEQEKLLESTLDELIKQINQLNHAIK